MIEKMEAVSKETIEVLNYAARYAMDTSYNAADLAGCGRKFTAVEACMAILPAGWEVISEDGNTSLIRTPSGLYVNLWTEGLMSHDIEDGGIGFDDQIDHYEEREHSVEESRQIDAEIRRQMKKFGL